MTHLSLLISQVVSGLVLEEFLEFEALDEAVAEAALLSRQQVARLQRQKAALRALAHCRGGQIVVKLLLQVLCQHLQVELLLHFVIINYLIYNCYH